MPVTRKKGRKGPNGEPVWRVRVWIEGHQHERLFVGSKAGADEDEARFRLELAAEPSQENRTAPTFSDFSLGRYQTNAQTHLRASTWRVRKYQLATLIKHLGGTPLTALGTEVVDGYKARRRAEKAQPRTINNELAVFQAVLHYARDLGLPCASPKVKLLPVVGRGRVTFWTLTQLGQLYAAVEAEAPALLPIVVALANTGCRKGEALALELERVDLERGMITIEPSAEWQPKDNEPREIPVSDALRPWLERAASRGGRWAFPSSTGERWACWPKRAFDRARKAAGLRGGPHTLRHTFAAHFLQACPDIYLLSKILGHSETRTTAIYSHLLPSHLERARNAVNLPAPTGPAMHEAKKRWATK